MEYKLIETEFASYIERINDNGTTTAIPIDPANADYKAYLNPDKVEHLTEIVPADE